MSFMKCSTRTNEMFWVTVDVSHIQQTVFEDHGDNPLPKPTGILVATVFGYELQFLLSGVISVFQHLNYRLHGKLSDTCRCTEVIKNISKRFLPIGG